VYVATTLIQMGASRFIQAGEPVPDFESWPYAARKANLDLGRVKLVAAPVSETAQTPSTAVLVTESATNLPEALAALNESREPAEKKRRRNRKSRRS